MRQRSEEQPKSLRERVNSTRGTFAREVLNIGYAMGIWIRELGRPKGHPERGVSACAEVSDSFAQDAGANRILLH